MAADSNYNYWDSCIFIDGLKKTAGRYPQILQLEIEARAGSLFIFASALAIAEVVKLKDYGPLTEDEAREIANYFRHKFVRILPVDRLIARSAAQIVREHDLKPPDAIHVATALRARCAVMYTYDRAMYTYDRALLDKSGMIGEPAIPIKSPGEFGTSNLFSSP